MQQVIKAVKSTQLSFKVGYLIKLILSDIIRHNRIRRGAIRYHRSAQN